MLACHLPQWPCSTCSHVSFFTGHVRSLVPLTALLPLPLLPSSPRSVRPFGVSTLLATYGKEGPQLYLVEPSGTMHVSGGLSCYVKCCF